MYASKIGSKEGQDSFVSRLLGARVFVDIGCSHGQLYNNTWALEQTGWRGWLFERRQEMIEQCKRSRKAPAFQIDAATFDFRTFFREQRAPNLIDYVSFDVDSATVPAVKNFPFEDYSFLVMTIEHDLYRGEAAKEAIVERLKPFGHYRVLGNSMEYARGKPFEDWIVKADYFPAHLLEQDQSNQVWWEFIDQFQF